MEDGVISEDETLTRTHDQDEGKEQGAGGGGLINHVLSSLVPKGQGDDDQKVGESGREVKEGEHEVEEKKPSSSTTGGGILDQLKSTLVSPRASTKGNRGDIFRESDEVGEVGKGKEEEEEEASSDEGNGIIGNIVSHLSNLPDDAAPSTDEASILIHSIVRD